MGKIEKIKEVKTSDLVPYGRNAKTHSPDQVEKIADSIREFGFISPCLIDKKNNIIAGHGRVMAAKQLGMETVPCLYVEGLSDEQRRAYILADNRLTELGDWDMDLVMEEIEALHDLDFDVDVTGFDVELDWFENHEKWDSSREEGNSEYNDFLDKFEQKKTTDDCYTPENIYEAIAEHVSKEYKVSRKDFCRPFYPGGDYQNEKYKAGAIVVDNPPFSIMAEIVRFYTEKNIKFFLFAPGLTLLGKAMDECCTAIAMNIGITYENGATVSTSFLTNLEPENIKLKSCPALYKVLKKENDKNQAKIHSAQRKYEYPDNVITAMMVGKYSKYGVEFQLERSQAVRISALDQQAENGDAIFGGGYLVSEKAAAEKAAAEKAAAEKAAVRIWQLSEREKEIVRNLGKDK